MFAYFFFRSIQLVLFLFQVAEGEKINEKKNKNKNKILRNMCSWSVEKKIYENNERLVSIIDYCSNR